MKNIDVIFGSNCTIADFTSHNIEFNNFRLSATYLDKKNSSKNAEILYQKLPAWIRLYAKLLLTYSTRNNITVKARLLTMVNDDCLISARNIITII
jgi:hypothetical protein